MTAAATTYTLRSPCANCPFRTDVAPYLRPDRAREIAAALRGGSDFPCHKTTVPGDDDEDGGGTRVRAARTRECAGALILMEKDQGPNQLARIAERLGLYDPDALDMAAPVFDTLADWVRHYDPTPTVQVDGETLEYEHCGVVAGDCEDPAGYGGGGGTYENDETPTCHPVDDACHGCGALMCGACRAQSGPGEPVYCVNCAEEETE